MKDNVIKLYKHFCELAKNPVGNDLNEREVVKARALKNKSNLEAHFKSSRKYRSDPEVLALFEVKSEVVDDGKKSKR